MKVGGRRAEPSEIPCSYYSSFCYLWDSSNILGITYVEVFFRLLIINTNDTERFSRESDVKLHASHIQTFTFTSSESGLTHNCGKAGVWLIRANGTNKANRHSLTFRVATALTSVTLSGSAANVLVQGLQDFFE